MAAQPRIEEASKPKPSSNWSSPSSPIGKVRCCQEPGKSVKRTETNLAPWSAAYFKTVLGVLFAPARCLVRSILACLTTLGKQSYGIEGVHVKSCHYSYAVNDVKF